MSDARRFRIQGVVQGVGFRPFVYRLARRQGLAGWVLNAGDGVEIHAEGADEALARFAEELRRQPPPAAEIAELQTVPASPEGCERFEIRQSATTRAPTVRISPDLAVCDPCLAELFDPTDRRHRYPYINCTDCGPRYTIIQGLPYDRPLTTMRQWPMCDACADEYHDPGDRRFHAQPVACPECGPTYFLTDGEEELERGHAAIRETADRLREGGIVAVKGLGGYHLACDAENEDAVQALRERKFRKDKPFALMVRDLETARRLVDWTADADALLESVVRPIVLARARRGLAGVAPDNTDFGIMLPSTPLHHLLFESGAPGFLVMTSANRSSEPIAYEDDDAFERLAGIADRFLVGERPIARRVDDSVVRSGPSGPTILRRARGYAPGVVARLPARRPLLAVGADLKNTVTLVVNGDAFVSQHIGDLGHPAAREAFRATISDLTTMYEIDPRRLLVAHDLHPEYASTVHARELEASEWVAVQHHRAHVAAVLAERGELETRVLGIAFDGTGYGDDGSIWGGELFVGSVAQGFDRVAHLRPATLVGGDAAARSPVQAAVGFLAEVETLVDLPDLSAPPFRFPPRYDQARRLFEAGVRCFPTTSTGRLFDTAAALLGFTREVNFEAQAASWLEHRARQASPAEAFPCSFRDDQLDYRPLLAEVIEARRRGEPVEHIARGFQRGLATGLRDAAVHWADRADLEIVVLSGGVFQNELLLRDLAELLGTSGLEIWTHRAVPPNDGGISLGQAALAAFWEPQQT